MLSFHDVPILYNMHCLSILFLGLMLVTVNITITEAQVVNSHTFISALSHSQIWFSIRVKGYANPHPLFPTLSWFLSHCLLLSLISVLHPNAKQILDYGWRFGNHTSNITLTLTLTQTGFWGKGQGATISYIEPNPNPNPYTKGL